MIFATVVGDAVPVRLASRKHVAPRCEMPAKEYACLSCVTPLANQHQRDEHCATGDHVIVVMCKEHGAEEWAPGDAVNTNTMPASLPAEMNVVDGVEVPAAVAAAFRAAGADSSIPVGKRKGKRSKS